MQRRRIDPRSFDLSYLCPHCGYKIPPAELVRTDGEHIKCPRCGQEHVPVPKGKHEK